MKMLGGMAVALSLALAPLVAADAAYAQPLRHGAIRDSYDGQANPHYQLAPNVTVEPVGSGHFVRCIWRKGCSEDHSGRQASD